MNTTQKDNPGGCILDVNLGYLKKLQKNVEVYLKLLSGPSFDSQKILN